MAWTITRLVGCNHLLSIRTAEAVPVVVAPSNNPNGDPTGPGRPGKQRISFILSNDDLSFGGDLEEGANIVSFAIDSGIAFQSPPNALATAADAAEYAVNTPLDLSTFIPIMHFTPLSPAPATPDPVEGDQFIAWEAKPYISYNQASAVGSRIPTTLSQAGTAAALPDTNPSPNGQIFFDFGTANTTFI